MTDFNKESETIDRRIKNQCLKLDTFQNIAVTLERIEEKVDELSNEMRTMIKLEQQVLSQSKDIERLSKTVDELRDQNKALSDRILELRSNFETQKQSIGSMERVGWAAATAAAIVLGKYLGIS